MRIRARADMKSLITDGRLNQGIEPLEEYVVIEINSEYYRVVNDNGEPILYKKPLFEVIDRRIPAAWEMVEYEDGDYFLNPVGVGGPGFYEAFFFSSGDRAAFVETHCMLIDALKAMKEAGSQEDRLLLERDLRRLAEKSSAP